MTDSPSYDARTARGLLLASFLPLGFPIGVLALVSEPGPGSSLLWLTGVVPVLVWARARRWRGVAVATAAVLATALATHAAAGVASDPGAGVLPEVFLAFVGIAAGIGWLTERLRREHAQSGDLALTDPLTGLPNRRHAGVFLETMFGAAERGRPMAVVLFDLDRLGPYVERNGRAAGDEALRAFAHLLGASTRRMNLSARIGGEEFLAILAGTDGEGALAFANRIRETFSVTRLPRGGLTVSAGVAAYHPSMRGPDELLAAADLALFRAKRDGRDRVRIFGKDLSARGDDSANAERPVTATERPVRGGGYPRVDADIGRVEPPVELLPPGQARFGQDRAVLLVEQDGDVEGIVTDYLDAEGFGVEVATTASAAVRSLGREFDVVITDLELPGLPPTELVKAIKSRWPATQVLVLNDPGEADLAAEALGAGADRYLEKPLSLPILQAQLVDALGRRDRLRADQRERRKLSEETLGRPDQVRSAVIRAALTLVRAGELRDPFLQGHGRRVAGYAAALLDALGDEAEGIDRELFHLACLVHDVGMVEVPEAILRKTGPLTAEEFDRVRRHPGTGRRLLEVMLGDELVLAVTTWHHERWDGSGYPDGLAGQAIPRAARLAAIADALDAMTSPRAYRSALEWEDAVRQVSDRAGTHFDPDLTDAFRRALPRLEELHRGFRPAEDAGLANG